ncbi:MBOAT-domain-containing protein [Amylocystis lapponica]|nr:MBOAT-domain-containing protein [Amylocystis lapponica]
MASSSQPAHAAPPLARSPSVGFQTPEGTVYVSKPFRSSSSNKMRATITFSARKSHFDISNESSGTNEFRGFFTLFWISMFIFTVRTYVRSIETNGYALEFAFATMFSRDAVTLAISDAVLVLSTGLAVPLAKAVSNGYIRYYWTGVVIQHLWQTTMLVTAITWTFNRQWPWVQSGFLTLHSIVMLMKVHSYVATNGQLQTAREQADEVFVQLRRAATAEGGWDAAIAAARANQPELNADGDSVMSGSGTPMVPEGTTTAYIDPSAAVELRQRLAAVPISRSSSSAPVPEGLERSTQMKTTGTRIAPSPPPPAPPSPSQVLAHHPVPALAELARTHAELETELTSMGPARVRYPENISLRNFAVYQLIPTLVYELEYPRTERISPLYVFEKTVATFGTFALLYTVVESFILPLTPTPDQSFLRSLLDLSLPFMISYLLLFYIIFECICNGFAELSYFADRRFYDDWWNSTSWDEFARKWNRPVHTFLLRHVYASTMSSYALTRGSAMFVTFLISAAAHELVMMIVTKKIRMYLFTLQLIQIPLIAIGRIPAIKRNKLLGNIIFWLGMYVGLPLLCVAYVAY